ncbi:MAG: non-canonical purine NTP pyrophosphatase, partial [[Clostridium] leptum]
MQFVMATNNLKKRDEMERILKELGIEVLTAKQAGADLGDVEETGTTFEENAYIKAKAALD